MRLVRRAFIPAVLALVACASVPKAPAQLDEAVKQFAPPTKGRAALYVFRNEPIGRSVKMSLDLDGEFLGDTAPRTFHWRTIKPGKHTLVGRGENESKVEFTAKPGQNIFVWQEVKMGLLSATNRLEVVDEATGHAGVSQCELAEIGAIAE